ncbi:MAG: hypothetical protein JEZ07_05445 [Phycisphaerae bacterium]|nr:hypothetical protein [Phycisphaerae bacterium]
MEENEILDNLLDLAEQLKLEIRRGKLGGAGGGLCKFKGSQVLFVDEDASDEDSIDSIAEALSGIKEVENMYILPQIREILEKNRQ